MFMATTLFADGTRFKTLMFFGDQLTVERARSAQRARIASDTIEDSLSGLEPAAADWHAEANFLQVCYCMYGITYNIRLNLVVD